MPVRPSRIGDPRPLKQRYSKEYPWEVFVTLCIAATCQHNGSPYIVLLSDWRIEDDISGSETMQKQGTFLPGWHVLLAGKASRAHELAGVYKRYMSEHLKDELGMLTLLKEPAKIQKERIVDEYLHSQICADREWLMSEGKDALPADRFAQLVFDIPSLTLEAQIVICGFVKEEGNDQQPIIALVDDTRGHPHVRLIDNFVAIGSGSVIALGGRLKTGHRWTLQNRPTEQNQNKSIYTLVEVVGANIFGLGLSNK